MLSKQNNILQNVFKLAFFPYVCFRCFVLYRDNAIITSEIRQLLYAAAEIDDDDDDDDESRCHSLLQYHKIPILMYYTHEIYEIIINS